MKVFCGKYTIHHQQQIAVCKLSKALVQMDLQSNQSNMECENGFNWNECGNSNSNSCGHECVNLSKNMISRLVSKRFCGTPSSQWGFLSIWKGKEKQKIQCKFVGNFCVLIRHIHREMSIVLSIVPIW